MTEEKKMELLEEMLEVDEGTLKPETLLADLEEWDSIAILSFIVLLDEEFGKSVKAAEIRKFNTIADALKIMEK